MDTNYFDPLPIEMHFKIFSMLPLTDRLPLEKVSYDFRTTSTFMVTSSEDIFRYQFIEKVTPKEARSQLLKYQNLRVLNMDLASSMFPESMTKEEVKEFSNSLALGCPKISKVYMSNKICFEIIALYCLSLMNGTSQPCISKIHAVVDSKDTREILEKIQSLCPKLVSLDVIDISNIVQQPCHETEVTVTETDEDNNNTAFKDGLDFETFDPEEISHLHLRSFD
jgi:hypothetical protein